MKILLSRIEKRVRLAIAVALAAAGLAACSGGAVALAAGRSIHLQAKPARTTTTTAPAQDAAVPVAPPVTEAVPDPTTTTAPPVQPMGQLHRVDALVSVPQGVTDVQLQRLGKVRGVDALEVAAAGPVVVGGTPAFALGVVPDSFRNFTPQASAKVDQLWTNVASGGLAFSYDMAHERSLTLGGTIDAAPAGGAAGTPRWISAFLSSGLPGVDVVADQRIAGELGLVPRAAVLVSAPRSDVWELQQALRSVVPGADVELLRATPVVDTKATFLSAAQISTIITAATSRVGLPYVWGGTGPNSFDCSGLVGWAFRAAGFDVPRTAAQLYLAGPRVDPRRAQPGDLLFWANEPDAPGYVDHVAIYLGGGRMVVAPHTGDVVKITTVPMTNFMGVVRVDPGTAGRVGGPRYSDLAGHG